MRAVVVYESMYGNTHLIADAIGAGPAALTGRAAKGVNRLLREHGFDVVAEPASFLVTKQDRLEPQEQDRARDWAAKLAAVITAGIAQG